MLPADTLKYLNANRQNGSVASLLRMKATAQRLPDWAKKNERLIAYIQSIHDMPGGASFTDPEVLKRELGTAAIKFGLKYKGLINDEESRTAPVLMEVL